MSENAAAARPKSKWYAVRRCCCTHPKCQRGCNNNSHKISSLKDDHRVKVVRILIPNDPELRNKVLAKPSSYRAHTSHWSEEDKVKFRGQVQIKPGALPRSMTEAADWKEPMSSSKPTTTLHRALSAHPHQARRSDAQAGARPACLSDITNTPAGQRGFVTPAPAPVVARSPRPTQPVVHSQKRRRLGVHILRPGAAASGRNLSPVVPGRGGQPAATTDPVVPDSSPDFVTTATQVPPRPREAIDPTAVKHMEQAIVALEQRLKDAQARIENKDMDLATAADKLQQVLAEKEALLDQLAEARRSAVKVTHLEAEIARRNQQVMLEKNNPLMSPLADNSACAGKCAAHPTQNITKCCELSALSPGG